MAGTMSPYIMDGWVILPALPNGNIPAYTIASDGLGGMYSAFAIKWAWDVNFTVVGGAPLFSGDYDVCAMVLDTGNLWNTIPPYANPGVGTFQEILDGTSNWSDPDDHQISTNEQGVSAALGYWLKKQTTRVCEQSTDAQFWAGVTQWLQDDADAYFIGLPTPSQPPAPPAAWLAWDPLAHGVTNGLGLLQAQASRGTGHIDGTGRVIIASIPIP